MEDAKEIIEKLKEISGFTEEQELDKKSYECRLKVLKAYYHKVTYGEYKGILNDDEKKEMKDEIDEIERILSENDKKGSDTKATC